MATLKIKALAKHLECKTSAIDKSSYGDNAFNYGSKEYLVLTDREADKLAKDYILDFLWAFQGSFIQAHSNLSDNAIKALGKAQAELCEDANDLVKGVIKNLNRFVQDAISSDGRGHFLSGYDGEENEEQVNGKTFYIYRTN